MTTACRLQTTVYKQIQSSFEYVQKGPIWLWHVTHLTVYNVASDAVHGWFHVRPALYTVVQP